MTVTELFKEATHIEMGLKVFVNKWTTGYSEDPAKSVQFNDQNPQWRAVIKMNLVMPAEEDTDNDDMLETFKEAFQWDVLSHRQKIESKPTSLIQLLENENYSIRPRISIKVRDAANEVQTNIKQFPDGPHYKKEIKISIKSRFSRRFTPAELYTLLANFIQKPM